MEFINWKFECDKPLGQLSKFFISSSQYSMKHKTQIWEYDPKKLREDLKKNSKLNDIYLE